MPFLQEVIHKLELGGGLRYVRIALSVLAVVAITVFYNWRAFKNMASQEAMDSAQLAHNLAQGRGYSTFFIRPFSMFLLKEHNRTKMGGDPSQSADLCQIRDRHPDLANPPVYPVLLAGLMKVLPFRYTTSSTKPFWSSNGRFARYQPDFLITLFNQLLFFGLVVAVFFLARRLFDAPVAWFSAILLFGTEFYWRFTVSGLSTILLLLLFALLCWGLVALEKEAREPKGPQAKLFILAVAVGILVGLGGLTRYSFGWLILPVMVFVVLFSGSQRVVLALLTVAAFLAIIGPWVARNYHVSGTPFGTAGYAIFETTHLFPEYRLPRSLEPELRRIPLLPFWHKLLANTRVIIQNDLARLGGSWVSAFFLVGLLVGFRNLTIRRLRYFLLACLTLLIIVQALGRTQLSEEVPDLNSENLLILVAPLVLVYGVSLFFLLLEQIKLPFPEMRYIVFVIFGLVASLPMLFIFLPPRNSPVAYPPYFPPSIKNFSIWLKPSELTMSDVPWAVAWYADRPSVWLTLRATPNPKDPLAHEDFFAINDYQKPIHLLYMTPVTLDARFLTQWVRSETHSWGNFILQSIITKEVPQTFPLRKTQVGWMPEQLMLTDWERWRGSP